MNKNPYRVGDRVILNNGKRRTIEKLGTSFDNYKNIETHVTFTTGTHCTTVYIQGLDPAYHRETIEQRTNNDKNAKYEITVGGYTKTYDDSLSFNNDMQVLADFGTKFKAYKTITTRVEIK